VEPRHQAKRTAKVEYNLNSKDILFLRTEELFSSIRDPVKGFPDDRK